MKLFCTQLYGRCNTTKDLCMFEGVRILANSFEEAENWCENNASYLEVIGELVSEEPYDGIIQKGTPLEDTSPTPKESKLYFYSDGRRI